MSDSGYLTGPEALDVARLTGIGLSSSLHRLWESGDISPDAVRATDHVFIDLTRMGWWDRFRVAWVRIGGHYLLGGNGGRVGNPGSRVVRVAARGGVRAKAVKYA